MRLIRHTDDEMNTIVHSLDGMAHVWECLDLFYPPTDLQQKLNLQISTT